MDHDASRAAAILEDCLRSMVSAMPQSVWHRRDPGIVAFATGIAIPAMNGVTVCRTDADINTVRRLLLAVLDSGSPCQLQGRIALQEPLSDIAQEFEMVPDQGVPLMVLHGAPAWAPSPQGLPTLRELPDEERALHAEVMAAGFEAPIEVIGQAIELIHSIPSLRMYAAEVNGVPVSTAATILAEPDSVMVLNVATPPEHRRLGYGATVTAHAIRSAVSDGAKWAWLQSSPDGLPVYERMGFSQVESWPTWIQHAPRQGGCSQGLSSLSLGDDD